MNKFPHLKKYIEVLLHFSAWLLILGSVNASVDNFRHDLFQQAETIGNEHTFQGFDYWLSQSRTHHPWLKYLLLILFKAVFFYVNVYLILPRYQRIQPKWKVLPPILFNLAWCFLAEALIYQAYFTPRLFDLWFFYLPFESGMTFLMVLAFSYAYWAAKQWLLNKDDIEKLGKTNAELALLKNQVNPHFLFNTLNNLFAMAIERKANDLAESISQLTQLMRYSIYESQTEYIELHREITYLENYIKLQQLRFTRDDTVIIRVEVENENPNVRIAPMLLINFVENAFKHGVSLKQPSFITIHLRTSEEHITFSVENTIYRQNKENAVLHAGFGLEHTKKLLQMQYPQRHELQITEANGVYRVFLRLKLHKTKVEVLA
jgi:hypothetical protein